MTPVQYGFDSHLRARKETLCINFLHDTCDWSTEGTTCKGGGGRGEVSNAAQTQGGSLPATYAHAQIGCDVNTGVSPDCVVGSGALLNRIWGKVAFQAVEWCKNLIRAKLEKE